MNHIEANVDRYKTISGENIATSDIVFSAFDNADTVIAVFAPNIAMTNHLRQTIGRKMKQLCPNGMVINRKEQIGLENGSAIHFFSQVSAEHLVRGHKFNKVYSFSKFLKEDLEVILMPVLSLSVNNKLYIVYEDRV